MQWEDRGRSPNLEDRRARRSPARRAGIPLGIGGVVPLIALSALTGTSLFALRSTYDAMRSAQQTRPADANACDAFATR